MASVARRPETRRARPSRAVAEGLFPPGSEAESEARLIRSFRDALERAHGTEFTLNEARDAMEFIRAMGRRCNLLAGGR